MKNHSINKILYIILIIFLIGFFTYRAFTNIKHSSSIRLPNVVINNKAIKVEIAETATEQRQGLSGRTDLCADCGMLFIFPDSQIRKFWMKNMNFPLDIIWIDENKIVNISKNLPPEGASPQESYSSQLPVNNVLEVDAGYFERNQFKIGDEVKYNF